MPASSRNNVAKVSQMRVLLKVNGEVPFSTCESIVRESTPFSKPVATSSPIVLKDETKSLAPHKPLQHFLETLCEQEIKAEHSMIENCKEEVKKRFELLLMQFDADTLYYSCNDNVLKENNKGKNKRVREEDSMMPPPSSVIKKSVRKGSKKPRNDSEVPTTNIRTRSSTRIVAVSNNKENLKENEARQSTNDFTEFKTPANKGYLRRNRHVIATVTPGPNINAPQTILRRPNPGETAISLAGSPLLVSSEHTARLPQITIPLDDGRVMSVLAKDGLNPADFPSLDQNTISRLEILHEFLEKIKKK